MKIKSQFKDYYDYVAHVYGGGDPKITYVRNRLSHLVDKSGRIQIATNHRVHTFPPYGLSFEERMATPFKWMVVAGRYFLMVGERLEFGDGNWKILDKHTHEWLWARMFPKKKKWWATERPSYYLDSEAPELIDISRDLGAPVFCITDVGVPKRLSQERLLTIEEDIPVLSETGLPSMIPAEQMYQDISYFLGNKIHPSPDLDPPVKISDKDRIMQAGFDLKTSFRHPVK